MTGVQTCALPIFLDVLSTIGTPEQAVETFQKTRMDVLVLGNYVVRRLDGGAEERAEAAALGGQVEAQR